MIIYDITSSIVLFKNDRAVLRQAIDSFLNTSLRVRLYLVDNSPTDCLKDLIQDSRVEYIYNNKNLGFGVAHNTIIVKVLKISKYHLILNPDVYYANGMLEKMFNFLECNNKFGHLMPKVLYPDGTMQYLCKHNPTFFDLFARRFLPKFVSKYFKKRMEMYEFRDHSYNEIIENVPFLSGCFMLVRTSVFEEVGGFDEKIFMYVEDADLSRRILTKFNNIYFPDAVIFHHFGKGSHKKLSLTLHSIYGAFVYFRNWNFK